MLEEEDALQNSENLEMLALLPFNERLEGNIVKEQVELVGGANLFYRLNQSFKDMKVEPLFIREQWELYSWRKTFFQKHFPDSFWGTNLKIECLSFLLCCKFDQVSSLAYKYCSNEEENDRKQEEFNEVCIYALSRRERRFSLAALRRFDKYIVGWDLDYLTEERDRDLIANRVVCAYFLEGYHFSLNDAAAMVAEFYPSPPQVKTLEDIAMKAVIKNGISMEEMSSDLKKKSVLMLQGKDRVRDEKETCDDVSGFEIVDDFSVNRKFLEPWKRIVAGEGQSQG